MTGPAAHEPRVKPVRAPWSWGGALGGRGVAAAAAALVALLFGGLYWTLRERPLPRPRAQAPEAPQLGARIAAAQDRLKADPKDIAALVELGTLLFQKGKDSYVEAIGTLEEARELGAMDARIFYCLGVMYQEEGLLPFALTEYQRFLRHYPEDKEVRMLAAKLYYRMGLFSEAVGEYDRVKLSSPDDPVVEENLALSLWGAKQMDRAQASFGQLKALGGDVGRRAEYYLGEIAREAGRMTEAAEHFAAAGLLGGAPLPGLPDDRVHASVGAALQKLGRHEDAKASWEAVLRAAPRDPKAQAGLREANRRLAAARKAAKKK